LTAAGGLYAVSGGKCGRLKGLQFLALPVLEDFVLQALQFLLLLFPCLGVRVQAVLLGGIGAVGTGQIPPLVHIAVAVGECAATVMLSQPKFVVLLFQGFVAQLARP